MVMIGAGSTFTRRRYIKFRTLKTAKVAGAIRRHDARLLRIETDQAARRRHPWNGLGGGLEVAMSCHYRVMAANAKVGQPEVLLGIIPGAGGTQRLPRLCGAAMAIEMCTAGKPVAAAKALEAGIVDQIAGANLLDDAIAFARVLVGAVQDRERLVKRRPCGCRSLRAAKRVDEDGACVKARSRALTLSKGHSRRFEREARAGGSLRLRDFDESPALVTFLADREAGSPKCRRHAGCEHRRAA